MDGKEKEDKVSEKSGFCILNDIILLLQLLQLHTNHVSIHHTLASIMQKWEMLSSNCCSTKRKPKAQSTHVNVSLSSPINQRCAGYVYSKQDIIIVTSSFRAPQHSPPQLIIPTFFKKISVYRRESKKET
jgi:hypothetical protein